MDYAGRCVPQGRLEELSATPEPCTEDSDEHYWVAYLSVAASSRASTYGASRWWCSSLTRWLTFWLWGGIAFDEIIVLGYAGFSVVVAVARGAGGDVVVALGRLGWQGEWRDGMQNNSLYFVSLVFQFNTVVEVLVIIHWRPRSQDSGGAAGAVHRGV